MAQTQNKVNIGISLLMLFFITLVTGIILHLKKHGTIIDPRLVIKFIHWIAGILMIGLTCWHGSQFWKMFCKLKQRLLWFWIDTIAVTILMTITFVTGAVKLLSPVKIPHLGMWHYVFGIAMAIAIALHMVRGIPALKRLLKNRPLSRG